LAGLYFSTDHLYIWGMMNECPAKLTVWYVIG